MTEIFSEEEDRSSESENESTQSKRKSADRSRSGTESPVSGKSERTKDRSRSRSQSIASNDDLAGDDLQSREARLKAKLKEKFLKDQLDKKYKDSESKPTGDTKRAGSRSSSVSVDKDNESNDEGASQKSSKRTRNTLDSDQSDGTEKFDSNAESNKTDDESAGSGSDGERARTKNTSNGHKKRRQVSFVFLTTTVITNLDRALIFQEKSN